MSQNSTKKSKQSLKQLQNHIRVTLDIWNKTAESLEKSAREQVDDNMREALYFSAAIYRTCVVDLQGVVDGKVILSKDDGALKPVDALVNAE